MISRAKQQVDRRTGLGADRRPRAGVYTSSQLERLATLAGIKPVRREAFFRRMQNVAAGNTKLIKVEAASRPATARRVLSEARDQAEALLATLTGENSLTVQAFARKEAEVALTAIESLRDRLKSELSKLERDAGGHPRKMRDGSR